MYYTAKIETFPDLYDMFIASEAGFNLSIVQDLGLEELYIQWLTEYFEGRLPMREQIEYAIIHKWNDFRLHIPYLSISRFSSLMTELVDDMDYLASTNDLHFPMVIKWENMPSEWARFTKEAFDNDLPIKVLVDSKSKTCKVIVTKDFRGMFEKTED